MPHALRNPRFAIVLLAILSALACSDAVTGADDDGGDVSGSGRSCDSSDTCPVGEVCDPARGVCVTEGTEKDAGVDPGKQICKPGTKGCNGNDVSTCNESGTEWIRKYCQANQTCESGACVTPSCIPGEKRCGANGNLEVCLTGSQKWDSTACGDRKICLNARCTGVICNKGEKRCAGDGTVQTCNGSGTGFSSSDCPQGDICDIDSCKTVICAPGKTKCTDSNTILNTCNSRGTAWDQMGCGVGAVCDTIDGTLYLCLSQSCAPQAKRCSPDNRSWEECNDKGTNYVSHPCTYDEVCEGSQCVPIVCEAGKVECDGVDKTLTRVCNPLGTGWDPKGCGPSTICINNACVPKVCSAGYRKCVGQQVVECNADGTAFTNKETCDDPQGRGNKCIFGRCMDLCDQARLQKSYIGCEYYPTVTPNTALGVNSSIHFSVAVSNTTTGTANVTITQAGNPVTTRAVAPSSVELIHLPWTPLRSTNATTLASGTSSSYRLVSTMPVIVYQFNPLEYQGGGAFTYTNDASILLPVHAWGQEYVVAARNSWYFSGGTWYPGFYAVTASEDGTAVTLHPSPSTGQVKTGAGVAANGTGTVTVNRGQILLVASANNAAYDVTGTNITATKPIQVIGGHDCTYIPSTVAACDHIEESIFPTDTLSNMYLVSAPSLPGMATPKAALTRVIAVRDGTSLQYEPAHAGWPSSIAAAGAYVELDTADSFRVSANKPILVAQYMKGQEAGGGSGDPAMALAVTTDQFRADYLFHSPMNYEHNYINITAQSGATVTMDGAAVGGFTAIGGTGYSIARYKFNNSGNGTHSIVSTTPFGVSVYGYGQYTSYWYPGGLNLTPLNE